MRLLKTTALLLLTLTTVATLSAAPKDKETPPAGGISIPMGVKGMVDFSNAPERKNDKYPLSDQNNNGKWKMIKKDCDEFNSKELNTDIWWPNNPTWKGRQPTFFHASNVTLKDGYAVFKVNQHGDDPLPEGYTHTAGFIVGRQSYLYGYFEARLKPNNTPWVTGFWLQCGKVQPDWKNLSGLIGTEIDICENAPGVDGQQQRLNSNVHVHDWDPVAKTKKYGPRFGETHYVPFQLQEDFHTWGLEWTKEYIRFYIDGVMWREVENKYWHYAQEVKINNESNKWFGALPDDNRLEGDYLVDYFRVWQRKGDVRIGRE